MDNLHDAVEKGLDGDVVHLRQALDVCDVLVQERVENDCKKIRWNAEFLFLLR